MDKKEDTDHVEEIYANFRVAADEELGEGQGVWNVFRKNPRAFWVLTIVLVRNCRFNRFNFPKAKKGMLIGDEQSTAILQGAELSMSGSMLGSQAFCKVMGTWDDKSQAYVVAAEHVSTYVFLLT